LGKLDIQGDSTRLYNCTSIGVTLELVVDSSVLIAVLTGEPTRDHLIARTQGAELVAPGSVHWEVGNAFSALLKRRRLKLAEAQAALAAYAQIPIRFVDVELAAGLELADRFGLYAYDAFLMVCARRQRARLLTIDARLGRAAKEAGVELMEVSE
jgi:predicted nucleic acid-binding protein